MYIICGLGNPGRQYSQTRHNSGFMVADAYAKRLGIGQNEFREDFDGLIAKTCIEGEKILLVKPQTYMNNSGECLGPLVRYYGVPKENIILIHDEIEFPFGDVRIRKKGSAGTHNGMKSVISSLGFSDFTRLRFGIGPKREDVELYEYVLSDFNFMEKDRLPMLLDRCCDIIDTILKDGVDIAMNRFNVRHRKEDEEKTE